jgi:hypothetical protein
MTSRLARAQAFDRFIEASLRRSKCAWCERELRPCNMRRHVDAAHFHQLTVDEALAEREPEGARK